MENIKRFLEEIEMSPNLLYKEKDVITLKYSINWIKKRFFDCFNNIPDDTLNKIKSKSSISIENSCISFFQDISSIVDCYLKGTPPLAFEKLYSLLNFGDDENRLLQISKVNHNQTFFRMRGNEQYYMFHNDEMFHIPFEKRSRVTNQRFSITGFPCLYLGASLYVCWEELNRPELETVNCTAFKNVTTLNLIEVGLPSCSKIKNGNIDAFKQIILYLICTIIVKERQATFKFEYVIPQLLTQCVVFYNEKSSKKIDGITYISSRYYDERNRIYERIKPQMKNFVLPVRESAEEGGRSEYLLSKFKQSDTISPYFQHLKKIKFEKSPYINQYDTSIFKKQELTLSRMRFNKELSVL